MAVRTCAQAAKLGPCGRSSGMLGFGQPRWSGSRRAPTTAVTRLAGDEIEEFTFEGERFRLMDRQRGIRKPAVLASALTIRTVWRPEGAPAVRGRHRGRRPGPLQVARRRPSPPREPRAACRDGRTAAVDLVLGVAAALYQAIYPVYLVGEELRQQQFVVATDGLQHLRPTDSPLDEVVRRYLRSETLRRLHQPVFRSMVMRAYRERCAVCSLRHNELLDAAHIVEDRHDLGVAAVRNGLALCKIHHAAYDSRILGVRPDLVVEIRADILEETDGPLLEHGLRGSTVHRCGWCQVAAANGRRRAADPAVRPLPRRLRGSGRRLGGLRDSCRHHRAASATSAPAYRTMVLARSRGNEAGRVVGGVLVGQQAPQLLRHRPVVERNLLQEVGGLAVV